MGEYGSVTGNSRRGAVVGAIVGSLVLFGAIGYLVWIEIAKERAADAADVPLFVTEVDSLEQVADALDRLAPVAKPETKPDDYRRALDEVRAVVDAHVQRQSLAGPLPSGRPWPGQFAAARKTARAALDFYEGIAPHLDRREETARKTKDPRDFVIVDTDIRNVARTAAASVKELRESLASMKAQRDANVWQYGAAPKKKSARGNGRTPAAPPLRAASASGRPLTDADRAPVCRAPGTPNSCS